MILILTFLLTLFLGICIGTYFGFYTMKKSVLIIIQAMKVNKK